MTNVIKYVTGSSSMVHGSRLTGENAKWEKE